MIPFFKMTLWLRTSGCRDTYTKCYRSCNLTADKTECDVVQQATRWVSCQWRTVLVPIPQPCSPSKPKHRFLLWLPSLVVIGKEPRYPNLHPEFFCFDYFSLNIQKTNIQAILIPCARSGQAVFASVEFKLCRSMLAVLFGKLMSKTYHNGLHRNKL